MKVGHINRQNIVYSSCWALSAVLCIWCSGLVLRNFVTEEERVSPSNLAQQMLLRMLVSVFGIININLKRKVLFVLSEAT